MAEVIRWRDGAAPIVLTLTANPAVGATSATLATAFLYVTGTFTATFPDGETRTVTLTASATTCTWANGLAATQTQNTISVADAHSGAQTSTTALVANTARTGFQIQNLSGANQLYVNFGTGASSSVYSFILKTGSGAADGTGGSFAMFGPEVYRGLITIAGTSPSYAILEL